MKIAGIDVHKKVLMVVIVNGSAPEEKPTRRRFANMPSQLHQLLIWLQGQGGRRSGDSLRFTLHLTRSLRDILES